MRCCNAPVQCDVQGRCCQARVLEEVVNIFVETIGSHEVNQDFIRHGSVHSFWPVSVRDVIVDPVLELIIEGWYC